VCRQLRRLSAAGGPRPRWDGPTASPHSSCERVCRIDAMRQFDVIIERDRAGYYLASVPALRGCHTQAKSLDALLKRVREAIELCLEVEGERSEDLDFVGVQRVTVGT
jgi:predicted RNase H-like HicB family nuclease